MTQRREGADVERATEASTGGDPSFGVPASHAEQTFRLLVSSVKDYAIFMLDPEGRVATWNAGAERLKGYRASEIIGRHFSTFYPPEDIEARKPEWELEVARAEGRVEDEAWRLRKDGTPFWANVIITALYDSDGVLRGYGKVTRDLTERRRAENDRVRLAQANEAVRLRDEFVSIAAHELRTPVGALRLYAEAAAMIARRESHGQLTSLLDKLMNQVSRTSALVDRLFDVSRIASGRLTIAPELVDLREAVEEALEPLRREASAVGSTLTVDLAAASGRFDRMRIQQVVTNLVGNSIKYAAGKPIEVALHAEGSTAVLTVRDDGIGIPEDRIATIFERFERAAPVRHFGGLGLGLYITRQIVEAHGGSVSVVSRSGAGATFRVTLPIGPGPDSESLDGRGAA